jgi:tRNA (Thr-GGU) A37 N-methylase
MRHQRYELQPIGWVESPLVDRTVAPKQGNEGSPDAWLAFDARFSEGLRNLRVGDDLKQYLQRKLPLAPFVCRRRVGPDV